MEEVKETKYRITHLSAAVKKIHPDKGFFLKVPKLKDGQPVVRKNGKTAKTWTPVTVTDAWVTKDDAYQLHVSIKDNSFAQINITISKKDYLKWIKLLQDKRRFELLDNILRKNAPDIRRTYGCELRMRLYPAVKRINLKVTERLYNEKLENAKKCGQNLTKHCISLLEGHPPSAKFTEEEMKVMSGLIAVRSDALLMENGIFYNLHGMSQEERLRAVIEGKDYSFWRQSLISIIDYFQKYIKGKMIW